MRSTTGPPVFRLLGNSIDFICLFLFSVLDYSIMTGNDDEKIYYLKGHREEVRC
jgi:hypothetical protein